MNFLLVKRPVGYRHDFMNAIRGIGCNIVQETARVEGEKPEPVIGELQQCALKYFALPRRCAELELYPLFPSSILGSQRRRFPNAPRRRAAGISTFRKLYLSDKIIPMSIFICIKGLFCCTSDFWRPIVGQSA